MSLSCCPTRALNPVIDLGLPRGKTNCPTRQLLELLGSLRRCPSLVQGFEPRGQQRPRRMCGSRRFLKSSAWHRDAAAPIAERLACFGSKPPCAIPCPDREPPWIPEAR